MGESVSRYEVHDLVRGDREPAGRLRSWRVGGGCGATNGTAGLEGTDTYLLPVGMEYVWPGMLGGGAMV